MYAYTLYLAGQRDCKSGPFTAPAFQSLAGPHPHVQFPRKLSLFLMISCPSHWAEMQVCPWLALAGLGQRNPALPSASPQVLWSARTPGGLQGSCHLLGVSGKFWHPDSVISPLHLPKICVFSACLHSDRSTSLWSWASPAVSFPPPLPLLHPTHRAAPAGQDWTSSICHRKRNLQRTNLPDQPLNTQVPNPCPLEKPLSLWQATLCSSQEQGREGLVKHLWPKGILWKKGQAGGTVTMCCLGSHLWDSQQLCVCSCEMQHTHSIWLFLTVTSVCQRSSLGTKPVPRAQRSARRVGSDQCQELLPGQVSPSASPAASSVCWDGSCCTWIKTSGFWGREQLLHSAVTGIHESHLSKWFCPQHSRHQRCEKQLQELELLYSLIWENVVKKIQTCFLQP